MGFCFSSALFTQCSPSSLKDSMSAHLAWAGGGDYNCGAKSANDAKAAPRDPLLVLFAMPLAVMLVPRRVRCLHHCRSCPCTAVCNYVCTLVSLALLLTTLLVGLRRWLRCSYSYGRRSCYILIRHRLGRQYCHDYT